MLIYGRYGVSHILPSHQFNRYRRCQYPNLFGKIDRESQRENIYSSRQRSNPAGTQRRLACRGDSHGEEKVGMDLCERA